MRVLLFASYAEAIGASSIDLPLRAGATVDDVLHAVRALPGAGSLPPKPLVAVNHAYAPGHTVVATGDEVAIIPPAAGG